MFGLRFLVVAVLVMLLLVLSPGFVTSEGSKVVSEAKSQISMTVPEMAPEFLKWEADVLGGERFSNGDAILMIQFVNEDQTSGVVALVGSVKGQLHVLAFAAFYKANGWGASKDIFEDLIFLETGTPSGVLVRVAEAHALELFRMHLAPKLSI